MFYRIMVCPVFDKLIAEIDEMDVDCGRILLETKSWKKCIETAGLVDWSESEADYFRKQPFQYVLKVAEKWFKDYKFVLDKAPTFESPMYLVFYKCNQTSV